MRIHLAGRWRRKCRCVRGPGQVPSSRTDETAMSSAGGIPDPWNSPPATVGRATTAARLPAPWCSGVRCPSAGQCLRYCGFPVAARSGDGGPALSPVLSRCGRCRESAGRGVTGRCVEFACSGQCVPTSRRVVGVAHRGLRLGGLMIAMAFGLVLIGALTCLPGSGRSRRGAWALQRVSRWVLRALGVRVDTRGTPRSGPSLVVGNHVSWLDILVLTACAPMRLVAKSDIRQWPVLGNAAARTGSLFLQRNGLRSLPPTVAQMTAALRSGSRVQVFPEGTTRCGGALNPFRRAAFQAAIDAGVVVSPVTVRYSDSDSDQATSPQPAFVGDETLVDSVRRVIGMQRLQVSVHWLPAIPAIAGTGRDAIDRKRVAKLAENAVARDLRIPVLVRQSGPGPMPPTPSVRSAPSVGAGPQSAQRPR